jgi:hypothetical protein
MIIGLQRYRGKFSEISLRLPIVNISTNNTMNTIVKILNLTIVIVYPDSHLESRPGSGINVAIGNALL